MTTETDEKSPARVWDIPCQRCGHVTLRYHGPQLPLTKDPINRLVERLRYLDGSRPSVDDVAKCSECGEDFLPETFDPKRWHEYKDFDPAIKKMPTHGHAGDSPFTKSGV